MKSLQFSVIVIIVTSLLSFEFAFAVPSSRFADHPPTSAQQHGQEEHRPRSSNHNSYGHHGYNGWWRLDGESIRGTNQTLSSTADVTPLITIPEKIKPPFLLPFLRRREQKETDVTISDEEGQQDQGASEPVSLFDSDIYMSLMSDENNSKWRNNVYKRDAITRTITGAISFLSSLTLMIVILRSYIGLGSPLHRLLVGLSISDMMSSFSQACGNFVAPKEFGYYLWNARGNFASCNAQGFLYWFGAVSGAFYNWSLCFFYLAVIRFEKSDEYICKWIEPFLHAGGISGSFIPALYVLAVRGYYPYGTVCVPKAAFHDGCWFPHCLDYNGDGEIPPGGFTIPCGRLSQNDSLLIIAAYYFFISIATPIVFIVTMTIMFRAVQAIEEKAKSYGRGSLRLSAASSVSSSIEEEADEVTENIGQKVKRSISSLRSSVRSSVETIFSGRRASRASTVTKNRPSNNRTQSRAIFYRALGYVGAYIICHIPFLFDLMRNVSVGSANISFLEGSISKFFMSLFGPLQGFFNLLIFLQPQVLSAKRSKRDNLTWFQAFQKVLLSRGIKQTKRGGTRSGRRSFKDIDIERRRSIRLDEIRIAARKQMLKEEEKSEVSKPTNLIVAERLRLPDTVLRNTSKTVSHGNDEESG